MKRDGSQREALDGVRFSHLACFFFFFNKNFIMRVGLIRLAVPDLIIIHKIHSYSVDYYCLHTDDALLC